MELTLSNVESQLEILKGQRAEALRVLDRLDGEIVGLSKVIHHMKFDPKDAPETPTADGAATDDQTAAVEAAPVQDAG